MARLAQLGGVVALLVGAAGPAFAQQSRVALVEPGESLGSAVRGAVAPWGIEVVAVPARSPGATMPDSGAAARRLAAEHDVDAVVWASESEGGHALWLYDAREDRVVARPLTEGPPFDAAASAAAALSIKTLLRHSHAAPPRERWAQLEPGPAPVDAPTSTAEPETQAPPGVTPPEDGAAVVLRGALGARVLRTRPSQIEPRLGLGIGWWPSREGMLGLALDVESGTGVTVSDERFEGGLLDARGILSAVLDTVLVARLDARTELGVSLQVARLEGTVLDRGDRAVAWRVNPALDGAVGIGWRIATGFRLGLSVGLSWLVRRQVFLVRGNEVLELSALGYGGALTLEAGSR